MSVIDTLASLGLTLKVDNGKLSMTGLKTLSEGQAQYAVRLAAANKKQLASELTSSQEALDSLLAHLREAPGVRLHFHSLKYPPAFSLQFDEAASFENCRAAQELFFKAIDAIHFNAESLEKGLRPSAFKWPD